MYKKFEFFLSLILSEILVKPYFFCRDILTVFRQKKESKIWLIFFPQFRFFIHRLYQNCYNHLIKR
ncbi:hypothetical protein BFP71_04520 [Roseivirga misakiensis]|uniref:Uncharacterized protein n=1 Tax=Roseivirga misakiensis TaxID=1563681 RepID=A0A1E5T6A4_9BACT|nr:hypothetical protein BFP71_04520 [Roseivirga misakiensis]